LVALTLFDAMGLIIKHLANDYSAAQLSAWRNMFGLIPAVIALCSSQAWRINGKRLKLRQWKLALFRGAVVTFAQLCFYLSLGLMDFATASMITYASALFATALAIPILGERVGWLRWIAVLIGFVGVIMVIKPSSDGFTFYALLPFAAAAFYALVGVTARLFDNDAPSTLVNLYSSIAAAIGASLIAYLWGGFIPLASKADLAWIALMGGFGGTAVLILMISFRMTEQSNLAPFSYFGIPLAFGLGWLFFNETPWSTLFPGAVLIATGGLLIVWRERTRSKHSGTW
jgi:drug/metabolite transporter (DMT)-like permease